MSTRREKSIAGEVLMVSEELGTLSKASLQRVYRDVGPGRWRRLMHTLATAAARRRVRVRVQ